MTIDWTTSPPFGRRVGLMHAIEILHGRRRDFGDTYDAGKLHPHAPLIVEIGTCEAYNPDGIGNALLAFAWYAGRYGARVITVDNRTVLNAKDILRRFCLEYADIPDYRLGDAIQFAPELKKPIDLLYADGPDENTSGESWYVRLFEAIAPGCFRPGALMLFDDTDPLTFAGKGSRLIPKLLCEGWRQVPLNGVPVFPMALLEKV